MLKKQVRIFGIPVWEKRSSDISSIKNPKEWLANIFGNSSKSGIKVTQNTSLTFSAVYACVRIISNTVAMLPLNIYYKDKNGNRKIATKHPVYNLIHSEPNQIQTSFTFRQVMQAQACLKGNSYAIIKRNNAYRPIELQLIDNPDNVEPFVFENRIFYKVTGIDNPYTADDILHIKGLGFDGIKGKSVLTVARESIGSALAMQQYGSQVFASGSGKRVALTFPTKLNDSVRDAVGKSWKKTYGGIENSGEAAILEAGVDVKEIGMNPEDAQFISSREFSIKEIARYFGMILDLLAAQDKPTYASVEQRAIDFVKYTMMPWFLTWESEINRKLLRDDEKISYYTKFNIAALMRASAKQRAQFYKDMFYIGVFNRNEIRALEEMDQISKDGDKYYLQTTMAPADQISIKKEK